MDALLPPESDSAFGKLLNRPANSHKYNFGHVLIIGGSPGMTGAPLLAARAALRAGAGLVTVAAQSEVIDIIEARIPEVMTLRLRSSDTAQFISNFCEEHSVSCVVIGPGMSPDRSDLALALNRKLELPLIIDGGALNAFTADPAQLDVSVPRILTPHRGEFQRFYDQALPTDQHKLEVLAQSFADQNGIILALKGNPTYVLNARQKPYINHTGTPAMATAGSGDTLTGIIAALIGQLSDQFVAVSAAVYLHGLAGSLAAEKLSQPAVIASDIIDTLPAAWQYVAQRLS